MHSLPPPRPPRHRPSVQRDGPPSPWATRFTVLCLAASTITLPLAAQAQSSNALRFFAVGGTLASWTTAWWKGAALTDCGKAHWQARGLLAQDAELTLTSVGAAYGDCPLTSLGGWALGHQTDLAVGHWTSKDAVSGARSAWDLSAVPLLHWQRPLWGSQKLELEVGVGPAWLSEPHIGNRYKSTQFQFSDHLGVNMVGPGDRWRLGLHWRHISNLDIQTPNNGVDFAGAVFAWTL